MPLDFDRFINDYFQARPWMLERDGSFKISGLDMDADDPTQWGDDAATSDDPDSRSPERYLEDGAMWFRLAEWEMLKQKSSVRSAHCATVAIASALLGICSQLIRKTEGG